MIAQKTAQKLIVRRENLRQPIPKNLAENLLEKKLTSVTRRAKYILMNFSALPQTVTAATKKSAKNYLSHPVTLIIHLGMSGRILVIPPEQNAANQVLPLKHDHFDLIFSDQTRMVFNDPRRFGLIDMMASDQLSSHRLFVDLGPEPLSDDFTLGYFAEKLRGKKSPIKSALLDQTLVAGLGNIYVCEALYHAGISPLRRADALTPSETEKLFAAIRRVLEAAIAAGGSSWRDYAKPDGDLGYFQLMTMVYGREEEKCRDCDCTGTIKRVMQSGRSSFFCPSRQL